jgi:hypothetical protein
MPKTARLEMRVKREKIVKIEAVNLHGRLAKDLSKEPNRIHETQSILLQHGMYTNVGELVRSRSEPGRSVPPKRQASPASNEAAQKGQ